jgi:CubicO group peptidase (beta-lactamase class C family)
LFQGKLLNSTGYLADTFRGTLSQTVDFANWAFTYVPQVKSVKIADDLSAVTQIGAETPAGELGLADDCADRIWQAIQNFYRSRLHNQITLCVRRDGEIIVNRSIGLARGAYGDGDAAAGSVDTPFCLFSASKAISAMLLCKLEELNELSLSDTITHYIPQFARHGKDDITLAELISHRARVPSIRIDEPLQLTDHDYVLDQLCNARPHDAKQAYHAISGGFIIAEVVEKVTGEPIARALDKLFRKPLGMKTFTYGLAKKFRGRMSQSHNSGFPLIGPLSSIPARILGTSIEETVEFSNQDAFLDCALPAGNIFATAEECSRFYQMVLDDGVYDGRQVIHADTIRKARGGDFFPTWDAIMKMPAHFSRGGFVLNVFPPCFFGLDAPRAYGHLGFTNILTWADPQRDIAAALLSSGKPVAGPHLYNFFGIPNTINRYCPKK